MIYHCSHAGLADAHVALHSLVGHVMSGCAQRQRQRGRTKDKNVLAKASTQGARA